METHESNGYIHDSYGYIHAQVRIHNKKITLDEMCLQTQIIQTFLADLFVPFELFIESETVYNTYTAGAIAMHKFKQTVFGIIAECVAHTHTPSHHI